MTLKERCDQAVQAFEDAYGGEAVARSGISAITRALVKAKVLAADQIREAMIEQLEADRKKLNAKHDG